jgi:PAS domain-containing protein
MRMDSVQRGAGLESLSATGDLGRALEERTEALQVTNAQLTKNLEALRQSVAALQERLGFETLLSDLSAQFVNLASDQVEHEIEQALSRMCDHLALDMASLWQWTEANPNVFTMTHLHRPEGGPPLPERIDATEMFPWSLQELLAGRSIFISSMDALPPEAAQDRETFLRYGAKTSFSIPLSAGGGPLLGAVSFQSMRKEHSWQESIVRRIQVVGQVFANAIARKRADEALHTSEARLSMAAESADAGLWELDLETQHFWATDKARDLFGISRDRELTLDSFLTFVHPEDRERIQHTVEQVTRFGEDALIEYRSV